MPLALSKILLTLVGIAAPSAEPRPASQPAENRPPTNFLGLQVQPLDEPISTDRPDFTEATETIPAGHFQLEGGYTFTYDDQSGRRVSEQTVPEFLLRTGVLDGFELRIGWEGWSLTEELFHEKNDAGRTVAREDHHDGGTDMSVGFKKRLVEERPGCPAFSMIVEMSLPTGAGGKTSGDVDPGVKLLWSHDLTRDLSLAGNVNLAVPTGERGRFVQAASSISLAYAINDWLGSYVEYFGFYPNDRGTDAAHYINGGFNFQITRNLQFDVRTGAGLNDEADDLFAGVGFAIRF